MADNTIKERKNNQMYMRLFGDGFIVPKTGFVKYILNQIKKDLTIYNPVKVLNSVFQQFGIQFEPKGKGKPISNYLGKLGIISAFTGVDGKIRIDYDPYEFPVSLNDPSEWNAIIDAIQFVIGHELIHRYQMINLKQKGVNPPGSTNNGSHEDYLADMMEMMSFAYQAVEEMEAKGMNPDHIIQLCNNPYGPNRGVSATFKLYTYKFQSDKKTLNLFLSYIRNYLALDEDPT